jgi:hypothetical protein
MPVARDAAAMPRCPKTITSLAANSRRARYVNSPFTLR